MKNIRVYLLLTCLATCTYTLLGQTSEAPRTPANPAQMAAHRLSGSRPCLASRKRNRRKPLLCSQPRPLRFLVYGRV